MPEERVPEHPCRNLVQREQARQTVRNAESALNPAGACPKATPIMDTPFTTTDIGMDVSLRGLKHRGFLPSQVLDIGGSNGSWTQRCMKYFPEASYFLVEPMIEREPSLAKLKQGHANVDFLIAAVGERECTTEIGIAPDMWGTSFHHPGVERRAVPVVTLDGLLERGAFKSPDFIKLDIQGHEWYALSGATECLKSCRLVLSECVLHPYSPSMKLMGDITELLWKQGFMPYEVVDTLRRAHSGAMGQCDMLFIRKGDPLIDHKHFVYPETGTFFRK